MTNGTAAEAVKPVIEIRGVMKVYDTGGNRVYALRGVDLTVLPGDMIAIMGSSGSGKSTLMNILGCLDVPTSGTYVLDGVRVDGLDRNALADLRNQKLGFVFQGFNLLARTSAQDNHHPSELSGGQQQRVAIARALVTQPTLLLADEPTGNLDSHMTVEVMALFQALNDQGITILIVTHEPDVARYSRRIVEVRDGHIIRDHPVEDRRRAADDLARLEVEDPLDEPEIP
jgi:putative ABC transport system ATP-binding protein